MVGNTQLRYGAWKWSKLSYRTGAHFTYAFPEITNFSLDSALTAQVDDGRVFGRHSTVAVEIDEHHLGYSYTLGFKTGQINVGVETFLWWRAGWLLHVHLCDLRQPVVLTLGGFALPLGVDQVGAVVLNGPPPSNPDGRVGTTAPTLAAWSADGHGTVLQALGPTALTPAWDKRLDDRTERRHVAAPYHVTPLFKTARLAIPGPAERSLGERHCLAALSWTGRDRAEAAPWRVVSGATGAWRLSHPKLGSWEISHWSLPAL
jgi:hypothetical protein